MASIEEEMRQSRKAAEEIGRGDKEPRSTEEYIQRKRDEAREAAHKRSYTRERQVLPILEKVNGVPKYGGGCLYTATDNYGDARYRVAGNDRFDKFPGKYGFKAISVKDVLPGDIVQRGSYDELTGKFSLGHGLIFDGYDKDGYPLFNYSQGQNLDPNGPSDIKRHSRFMNEPMDEYFYRAYRFVGTPEDEIRWAQEYRNTHPVNSIPSSPLEKPGNGHYKIEKR